jgi:hypothetical protein
MEEELEVAAILPTAPCEHDACAADDITARDREYIEKHFAISPYQCGHSTDAYD